MRVAAEARGATCRYSARRYPSPATPEPRLRWAIGQFPPRELGGDGREEDADFFKAWLRSQYAETIREGRKGAKPQDYDRIGTEFHRWVRDRHEHFGLEKSADSVAFIQEQMRFYARSYVQVRRNGSQAH